MRKQTKYSGSSRHFLFLYFFFLSLVFAFSFFVSSLPYSAIIGQGSSRLVRLSAFCCSLYGWTFFFILLLQLSFFFLLPSTSIKFSFKFRTQTPHTFLFFPLSKEQRKRDKALGYSLRRRRRKKEAGNSLGKKAGEHDGRALSIDGLNMETVEKDQKGPRNGTGCHV